MGSTDAPDPPDQPKHRTDFAWPPTKEELATWEVVEFPDAPTVASGGSADPDSGQHQPDDAAHAQVVAKPKEPEPPPTLAVVEAPHPPATSEPHDLTPIPSPPASRPLSPRPPATTTPPRTSRAPALALGIITIVAAAVVGFFAGARYTAGRLPTAKTAAVHVESLPPGARVFVDGVERGQTPADFTVDPGQRRLEVASGAVRRTVEFTAAAGSSVSHHFQFFPGATENATEGPAGTSTGTLVIRSEPPGATVVVAGQELGRAPVTVTGLAEGEHDVQLTGQAGTVVQRVRVQTGLTTTLVVPMAGRTATGWLAVRAPIELTLLEDGRVINTTRSEQTMLTAGRHDIEFVNEEFEFRQTQTVVIPPGRRLTLDVPMPLGRANINARPWAEVWLGDRRLGETPLGNVALPLGRHEIVFRNPQLGERRQTVLVKATTPARVVADFRP